MAVRDLIPWNRNRTDVVGREERDPFFALHDEVNRLFNDFSRTFGMPLLSGSETRMNWPSIDVSESEKTYTIEADLPGLEQKDVEVLLTDNVLTIRGEKRTESSDDKRHFSERYYGSFERRIPLDAEVEPDKVKATFKNGVLKVEIPKSDRAIERSRRIPIQS